MKFHEELREALGGDQMAYGHRATMLIISRAHRICYLLEFLDRESSHSDALRDLLWDSLKALDG